MRDLKAEKIREMTEDEIVTRVRELHEEIFNLRFRNAMRQLQNPLLIRERKRDIARLHTILTEHRTGTRKLAGHGETVVPPAARKSAEPKRTAEPKREPAARKKEPKVEPAKSKTRATKASKK